MRNNNRINFTIIFICFICSTLMAQKNYKWDRKIQASPDVPEMFSDADAVIVFYKETRETLLDNNRILSRNIVKQRIKIQTQSGLERYARILLPKIKGMKSIILDARTIKKNGEIVDLDAKSEIKSLEFTDEDDFLDKSKFDLFSIPGVAVGDEIEIVSIQDGYTIERGDVVIPHQFIPIMEITFTVQTKHKDIGVDAMNVNNMNMPQVVNYDNGTKVVWKAKNLPGLYEDKGNISALSLPHFIYQLNLDRLYRDSAPPNIKSWKDLMHYANKEYFDVNIRSKASLKNIANTILESADSDSKIDKLHAIQKYMNEVEKVKLNEQEESSGIEYFLEEKKGDYTTIIKMYKALLSQMGIPYRIGSCRSRGMGPIDLNFPSYFQITDFIFLIPEGDGYFFLPIKSDNNSYNVNEAPLSLSDTKVHMISPGDKNLFRSVTLNGNDYKDNIRQINHLAVVSLENDSIFYERTETYAGALSTKHRNYHAYLKESKLLEEHVSENLISSNTTLDSCSMSEPSQIFPYHYDLLFDFSTNDQITKLDEKIYKIDLSGNFNHQKLEASKNRLLDYYPAYKYSDGFVYAYKFEQPVKLINKENIDRSVRNNAGSFYVSVEQVNPTTIIIKSKYIIKQRRIKKEDIQDLIDITDESNKADNEGLIIEIE